jgi:hypothetical protein
MFREASDVHLVDDELFPRDVGFSVPLPVKRGRDSGLAPVELRRSSPGIGGGRAVASRVRNPFSGNFITIFKIFREIY